MKFIVIHIENLYCVWRMLSYEQNAQLIGCKFMNWSTDGKGASWIRKIKKKKALSDYLSL